MRGNMIDRMADISLRLKGLKATRNVDISQIQVLEEAWPYSLNLAKKPDAGYYAEFYVTTICANNPIVDVGVSGLPYGNIKTVSLISSSISVYTVTTLVRIFNDDTINSYSFSPTITAYALNGLSASIVRTV